MASRTVQLLSALWSSEVFRYKAARNSSLPQIKSCPMPEFSNAPGQHALNQKSLGQNRNWPR